MAERLTMQEVIEHCDETKELMERVFTCVHDGGEFGQIESKRYLEHKQTAEWLRELQKYKDLEEQGRLITLPCKIGDTVYYREKDFNFAHPVKISEIILSDLGNNEKCFQFNGTFFDGNGDIYINYIDFEFDYDNFGKTVFLTKEEAEAALKGAKE